MGWVELMFILEICIVSFWEILEMFEVGVLDVVIVLCYDNWCIDGEVFMEELFGWMVVLDFEYCVGEFFCLVNQIEMCCIW